MEQSADSEVGGRRKVRSRTKNLIIALVGLFGTLLLVRTFEVSTHCLHDTRLIKSPPDGKYDVMVYEEACDGFGGSDVATLSLRRKHFWPLNTSVFAYDVDGEPPVVTWLDPRHVEVKVDSIESLDDIHYQLREANGIHISYTVTHVGAPAFSPEDFVLLDPNHAVPRHRSIMPIKPKNEKPIQ